MARNLGRPYGNRAINGSDADASDDTPDAHHRNILGRGLENRAKQCPKAAEDDSLDSSTAVCEGTGDKSSN